MKNLKRKTRRTRTWSSDSGFCDPGILDQEDFTNSNAVSDVIENAISSALDGVNEHVTKKFKILKHSFKDYCRDFSRSEEDLLKILKTKIVEIVSESADVAINKVEEVLNEQLIHSQDMIEEEDDVHKCQQKFTGMVDYDLTKAQEDECQLMENCKRKAETQLQQRCSKHQKLCIHCEPLDIATDDEDDDFQDWDWSSDEWDHEDVKDKTDTNQDILLKNHDDPDADDQWNDFNFWKINIEDVADFDYDTLGIEIGVNDSYAFHDPQAQDLLMIHEECERWKYWNNYESVQNILDAYEAIQEEKKPNIVKIFSKKMISEFCDINWRRPEKKMKRYNQERIPKIVKSQRNEFSKILLKQPCQKTK